MFQPLDIFETDSEGGVLWRSAAEDFVAAKRCIENLALSSPGEYLILDQQTGQRQRMKVMLMSPNKPAPHKGGGHDVQPRKTSIKPQKRPSRTPGVMAVVASIVKELEDKDYGPSLAKKPSYTNSKLSR